MEVKKTGSKGYWGNGTGRSLGGGKKTREMRMRERSMILGKWGQLEGGRMGREEI